MFDFPMAVGILIAINEIRNKELGKLLDETIFIGELSLDGNLNKISGILPICIEAKKLGIKNIILPEENAKEASIIEGINILSANHLTEVISYLNGDIAIKPKENKEIEKIVPNFYDIDFSEVKGQEAVKRALEISAAGRS